MRSKNSQVLVFGARGYLGRYISEALNEAGYLVVAADRSKAQLPELAMLDREWLKGECERARTVIYCAFDHFYKVNVVGLQNLISVASASGVDQFVYLSSISAFDIETIHSNDPKPTALRDVYSVTKCAELTLMLEAAQNFRYLNIIAPSVVISPDAPGGGWDAYFSKAVAAKTVEIPNDGLCPVCSPIDVSRKVLDALSAPGLDEGSEVQFVISRWERWSSLYQEFGSNSIVVATGPLLHHNALYNSVLSFCLFTPFHSVANKILVQLKRRQATSKKMANLASENVEIHRPKWITRYLHFTKGPKH